MEDIKNETENTNALDQEMAESTVSSQEEDSSVTNATKTLLMSICVVFSFFFDDKYKNDYRVSLEKLMQLNKLENEKKRAVRPWNLLYFSTMKKTINSTSHFYKYNLKTHLMWNSICVYYSRKTTFFFIFKRKNSPVM